MGEHSRRDRDFLREHRRETRWRRDARLSEVDRELRIAEGRDPDGTMGVPTLVAAGIVLGLLFLTALLIYWAAIELWR